MKSIPRILIVEDDPGIRDLLSEILETEGFDCHVARDGVEATEKLKIHQYDLLITDFRMPKMDGIELLQWCERNFLYLPVIFITADFLLPDERLMISRFNPKLLSKPICLQEFLHSIHSSLESSLVGQCPA